MKLLLVAACLVACGKSGTDVPKGPRTQVTYSLDLDLALDERGGALRQDIEAALVERKLQAAVRTVIAPAGGITVVPEDPASRQAIDEYLKATYTDAIAPRECEPNAGTGAICIKLTESHAMAIKKAALENAVKTIRSRLEALEVAHPRVAEQGGRIVVSFPENDEQGAKIRDLIARTGKLEFKVVDHNSPYMRQVYAQVGADGANGDPVDPRAQRDEIRAEVDQWQPDDGGLHTDFYLIARDREETLSSDEAKRIGCFAHAKADGDRVVCKVTGRMVIDRYLRELAQTNPQFKLPDDREIGYELVEPPSDAKDQRPFWRTYYLDRAARLTGSAISNAMGMFDPNTNRPIVLLDFGKAGARTFEQLTSEIVGKKLATILDGKIKSAPIVNGPIRGGRASITMGGSDARRQELERDELVTVLKTGSLPAPLREESVTTIGK